MPRHAGLIRIGVSVAVVGAGAGGMLYLVGTKPAPPQRGAVATVPEVAVVTAEPRTFDAPVVGHGTVQPKRQVKIVPEVGGRLVHVHADLAIGKVIKKDDSLFEIDSESYRLQAKQGRAEIKRLEAQLAQLHEEAKSLEAQVVIERDLVALADRNRQREQNLEVGVHTTDVELVTAEIAYRRQQQHLLECEMRLQMSPYRIAEVEAMLELKEAQLAESQRRIDQTTIRCPFDARVESVSAAASQVVIAGFGIATLTDLEALELVAGIDPRELRWTEVRTFARAMGQDLGPPPEATVAWSLYDQQYSWRGPVTRMERVDEATRTARVVVEIRDIMKGLSLTSGQARPPLSIGMFCRVEIPAEPLSNALVVPRSAIQDGADVAAPRFVFVFEPDHGSPDTIEGRLGIRRVPVLRIVDDEVLVSFGEASGADRLSAPAGDSSDSVLCELRPGDQIVISPLPRAAEHMRLRRLSPDAVTRLDDSVRNRPAGVSALALLGGTCPTRSTLAPGAL